MDFGSYSGIITAAATGAALYFSPYTTSWIMAGVTAGAVTYGVRTVTSGDPNHLYCAGVSAAGASVGYYGGQLFGFDPQLASAIVGPGACILFSRI